MKYSLHYPKKPEITNDENANYTLMLMYRLEECRFTISFMSTCSVLAM